MLAKRFTSILSRSNRSRRIAIRRRALMAPNLVRSTRFYAQPDRKKKDSFDKKKKEDDVESSKMKQDWDRTHQMDSKKNERDDTNKNMKDIPSERRDDTTKMSSGKDFKSYNQPVKNPLEENVVKREDVPNYGSSENENIERSTKGKGPELSQQDKDKVKQDERRNTAMGREQVFESDSSVKDQTRGREKMSESNSNQWNKGQSQSYQNKDSQSYQNKDKEKVKDSDVPDTSMAKMFTMVGTQKNFSDAMKSLIELEYDALEAYKLAVDKLSSEQFKSKIKEFMEDHKRHISELSGVFSKRGEEVPKGPDMKQYLTKGKVYMASIGGDISILQAMLTNEGETNVAYERMVNHEGIWDNSKDILKKGFEDEKRHAAWINKVINDENQTLSS